MRMGLLDIFFGLWVLKLELFQLKHGSLSMILSRILSHLSHFVQKHQADEPEKGLTWSKLNVVA